MLFEASFSGTNVAMRTVHRELPSLENFHDLRGDLGKMQQNAILEEQRPRNQWNLQHYLKREVDMSLAFNRRDFWVHTDKENQEHLIRRL